MRRGGGWVRAGGGAWGLALQKKGAGQARRKALRRARWLGGICPPLFMCVPQGLPGLLLSLERPLLVEAPFLELAHAAELRRHLQALLPAPRRSEVQSCRWVPAH